MHVLPPRNHPARGMFDIRELVEIGTGKAQPYTLQQAKIKGRDTIRQNAGIVRRVCFFVIRANDMLQLVSVGRNGAHRVEWSF